MNAHFIRDTKIRTKLLIGLIILGLVTVSLSHMAVRTTNVIHEQFDAIADESAPRTIALLQLKAATAKIEASTIELSTAENRTEAKEALLASQETLQSARADYAEQAASSPEKAQPLIKLADAVNAHTNLLVSAFEQKAPPARIAELHKPLQETVDELGSKIDQLAHHEIRELRERDDEADENAGRQIRLGAIAQVVALVLVIALGFLLSRLVVRPLSRLRTYVDAIAKGDLDAKLPITSKDEIGELAASVDKLRITVKYLLDDTNPEGPAAGQKKK